jgi:magnesium-transporting ATPase (P-type)
VAGAVVVGCFDWQVLQAKLEEVRRDNLERLVQPPHTNCGIVIEGGALHVALDPELQDDLMALCKECKAVVCCRVSPMQKAQVTWLLDKCRQAFLLLCCH